MSREFWRKRAISIDQLLCQIFARWFCIQKSSSPARHVSLHPLACLAGLPFDPLQRDQDLSNDDDLAGEILGDYFAGAS